MTWHRDRWVDALPLHEETLRALPLQIDRHAVGAASAGADDEPAAAVRALIAVMVWGFGTRGYGPFRVRRMLRAADAPRRLALVSRTLRDAGPLAAYRRMANSSDCRVAFLGPAFGTKFLYFCQPPPTSGARALILDRYVADWLQREAAFVVDPWSWSPAAYGRYLDQMQAWAELLKCAPDDLERLMFEVIATERDSEWAIRS